MKMVQSRKIKDANSTYKEKINYFITTYWLISYIDSIKEALWYCKKTCKQFALAGICDKIFLLMTKCKILHGNHCFGVNYQTLGVLRKNMNIPIHYIVWL